MPVVENPYIPSKIVIGRLPIAIPNTRWNVSRRPPTSSIIFRLPNGYKKAANTTGKKPEMN
ncbi:Uncharacterised protein [Streptococcus pneumoniae]|nr:Uncharacterised protein [Streptococcus pneumoniae]CKI29508.1 Uncharacterised protein [Streptococcus pneumoniae]COH16147.1 Uncharacterised protein [Streptococcus pneumoniae]